MVVLHSATIVKIKGSNPVASWNQESFLDVHSSDGTKFFLSMPEVAAWW